MRSNRSNGTARGQGAFEAQRKDQRRADGQYVDVFNKNISRDVVAVVKIALHPSCAEGAALFTFVRSFIRCVKRASKGAKTQEEGDAFLGVLQPAVL